MKRPLRILVTDHNEEQAHRLQLAVDRAGVEVPIRFVRDGNETIAYLKQQDPLKNPQNCPTLLLLELKGPRSSGFEVLRWLRTQRNLGGLLVVAYCASEDPDTVRRAYELGADSCIRKPENSEELLEAVRDMEKLWLRLNATPECGFVC
jgi:DNA-binding response OmpR family regulator